MKLSIATAIASILLASCALFTKENARTVLDISQVLCVVAHAETDDQSVQQICGIADALVPDLRRLLAEQRTAVARAQRAGACGPDAGAR